MDFDDQRSDLFPAPDRFSVLQPNETSVFVHMHKMVYRGFDLKGSTAHTGRPFHMHSLYPPRQACRPHRPLRPGVLMQWLRRCRCSTARSEARRSGHPGDCARTGARFLWALREASATGASFRLRLIYTYMDLRKCNVASSRTRHLDTPARYTSKNTNSTMMFKPTWNNHH
jgi:hypothetical protein